MWIDGSETKIAILIFLCLLYIYENDQRFKVENVLYHAEKEEWGKNYWLSPEQAVGEFILDLGCEDSFNTVELVNTHNAYHKDRSTKRFQVFLR